MRYLILLALVSCDLPTHAPQEEAEWYCYTQGSQSTLVHGIPCDGLNCPMTTREGDTIKVNPQNLTKNTAICR